MAQRLQAFAASVSKDLEQQDVGIDPISIITLIQGLLATFPCLTPKSSTEVVAWINEHPGYARNLGIRQIRREDSVKRRKAAEIYDRTMDSAVSLGNSGFAELIDEART